MALDAILARIGEDARDEAERLRAEGASRAEAVLAAARHTAATRRAELLAREEAGLRDAMRNRLAGERLAARARVLALRRGLLDEVLAEGAEAVRSSGLAALAAWVAGLVAGLEVPGDAELELGRRDLEEHGDRLAEAIGRELAARRPGRRLSVREAPGDFAAGFRVVAGGSVHDFSLAAIVDEHRARWEPTVAGILFGR